jgi:uncharacterized GH25 family protein
MLHRILAVLLACWLTPAGLFAHEIKVFSSRHALPEGGKATIFLSWGHRVPVDELVDAASLERYELVPPAGKAVPLVREGTSLQANVVPLSQDGVYAVLVTRKASVFSYVLDDEGTRQLKRGPKTAHPADKLDSATRYQQAGKALIVVGKPGNTAPAPLGLPIEITPLEGPARWTAHTDIPFQILLDGKPVPTAEVQARPVGFKPDDAWAYATESNRQGGFRIRPSVAGTWVIKVNVKNLTPWGSP